MHPALGDALFQCTAGIIPLEQDGSYSPYTYMPMGVRRVRLLGRPSGRMYVYAVRRSEDNRPSPESVEGDVFLLDEQGQVLVEMLGVRVQRVGRGRTAQREIDVQQWLYQVDWQPARAAGPCGGGSDGALADLCRPARRRTQLAARLRQNQRAKTVCSCIRATAFRLCRAGEDNEHETYRIDPLSADDYQRLLLETFGAESAVCAGVVHSVEPGHRAARGRRRICGDGGRRLENARRLGCGSVLQLIRQLARFHFSKMPGLWLATQGAQAVTGRASRTSRSPKRRCGAWAARRPWNIRSWRAA